MGMNDMDTRVEKGVWDCKIFGSDDGESWEWLYTHLEPAESCAEILLARREKLYSFIRCEVMPATFEDGAEPTRTQVIGEERKVVAAIEVTEQGEIGGYVLTEDSDDFRKWKELSKGNGIGHAPWWVRKWVRLKTAPWPFSQVSLWHLRLGGTVTDPATAPDGAWTSTLRHLPGDVQFVRAPNSFVYWEVGA